MKEKRKTTSWYLWLLIMSVLIILVGCDSSDQTPEWNKPEAIETGRLCQGYVDNAMVIADKTTSSGYGNFELDPGEVYTFSDVNGNYRLEIPKYYGTYTLLTLNGKVKNSKGATTDAFPMLGSPGVKNITPVTTLAVLLPELSAKIGKNIDLDIASSTGVPWNIMKIAKSVETVLALLTDKNNPIIAGTHLQFAVMKKIANELAKKEIDLTSNDSIQHAVYSALSNILSDNSMVNYETYLNALGITTVAMNCVEEVLSAIPNSGSISENTIQQAYETAITAGIAKLKGNMLAFDPAKFVLPVPNDMMWVSGNIPAERRGFVTLNPADAKDIATKALYMAINNLNIRGFSPNAPIGIPLANSLMISPTALQNNIKVINLSKVFGILYSTLQLGNPTQATVEKIKSGVINALAKLNSDGWSGIKTAMASSAILNSISHKVKAYQDGNYIKLIPLTPFEPGAVYLVIIEDKLEDPFDDFIDINGIKIKQPTYYKYLKSDSVLTDTLSSFEELRQQYAPIFSYILKSLGIQKDDTLQIFTFTTADKTLSLTDAAVISAAIEANNLNLLSNLTKEGLPYAAIRNEYEQFHNALQYQIQTSPSVTPTAFASFDITKLAATPPSTLSVPYAIYNTSTYTDTVIVFQHGLGQRKESGEVFAKMVNSPVIAIDLPLHGERAVAGKSYFSSDMITNRINLYQSVFDMALLVKSLKAGLFDINRDNVLDTPNKIYFVGQSLGSITGAIMNSYVTETDKIVLTVGGANLASIFDTATCSFVRNTIPLERNTTQYFISMGIMQLLIDPADPVYLVNSSYKEKVLLQNAHMDTFVPNISNEILARAIGYTERIPIQNFSGFNPSDFKTPGWYHFGNSSTVSANWIPHGFMLNDHIDYPEAFGYMNQEYVTAAHHAARSQINTFLFGN